MFKRKKKTFTSPKLRLIDFLYDFATIFGLAILFGSAILARYVSAWCLFLLLCIIPTACFIIWAENNYARIMEEEEKRIANNKH